MPKNSNSGFSAVPLVAVLSFFSVLSYIGYSYFSKDNTQDNSQNVLQANTANPVNISSFLFQSLFGVTSAENFNKLTTPIILVTNQSLDNCAFFPRSSRPLAINAKLKQGIRTIRVYQNVNYQVLPKETKSEKFVVVVTSGDTLLNVKNKSLQSFPPCKSSENTRVEVYLQPTTPITAANFRNLFEIVGENLPKPTIRPTVRPSVKPTIGKLTRPQPTVFRTN